MNGRMYDPQLGRFLSPDNYIQEPFNTQSYNRYGYAFNNPLMYVDPSGEFFAEVLLISKIIAWVAANYQIVAAAVIIGAAAIFGDWDSGGSGSPAQNVATPNNNQGSSNIASSSSSSGKRSAFNDGGLVALNIPAIESSINDSNVAFVFGDNLSYQNTQMVGVSQVGRSDPLQGVPRPEGWEYNPAADAQNFAEPASEGFNITTEDVLDTAMDFIPIVGGVKDIYKGIRDGDGWQVAIGAGSLVLDVLTLGSASVLKGAVKTGIKAGGRSLAKNGARKSFSRGPGSGNLFSGGDKGDEIIEGIYEFISDTGEKYVGQSKNIPKRLKQHIYSGALKKGELVKRTEVLGGKTRREIMEQLRIDNLGGIDNLRNIRNPVSDKRRLKLGLPKNPNK